MSTNYPRAEWFARVVELRAGWREHRAEEYPEERGSLASAEGLRLFATWLRDEPAAAEQILSELPADWSYDGDSLGDEKADERLSMYGVWNE